MANVFRLLRTVLFFKFLSYLYYCDSTSIRKKLKSQIHPKVMSPNYQNKQVHFIFFADRIPLELILTREWSLTSLTILSTFPEAERHVTGIRVQLPPQNVFTSHAVFSWSYEGQLPKANLFLTSSIFTSIQLKSLLQLSGPIHLQGVETVTGFFVSCMYMGYPSSYASNFFRIKGAAHSRATWRRKLAGRRAHSSHIFPFISSGSSFSTRPFTANISALLLQPPAASSALLRGLHLMLYIFLLQLLKCREKKKGVGHEQSFFLLGTEDILFGAWSLSNLFASSCHLHQHSTLSPTWSQFSRWTECIHTGQLPQPLHSLAQILKKTVQMPWGSSHMTVQTPDFYLRPGLWWCKFDFLSSSKFFLEACLHHLSPSCLYVLQWLRWWAASRSVWVRGGTV